MIPSLPRLEAVCPKCASRHVKVVWHEKRVTQPERLAITCARCTFAWTRAPLDSVPADLDVADVVKP